MKGVWVDGATQTLKDFPIPEPKEGQVLIKVAAAAQNPKDWKGKISLNLMQFSATVLIDSS
jgi:NADPH:quinone reductase-like Zn-dependent oxidoreductase